MKIENHKCFSLTKKGLVDPMIHMKARLGRVDSVLKFLRNMRPEDLNLYITKLMINFSEAVGEYDFDPKVFDWEQIREDLLVVHNFPELEKSVFLYICKTLQLPEDYTTNQGEVELLFYARIKAGEAVSYYLVRTFIDIYGKEEGTKIYKQIVPHLIREMKERENSEEPENPETLTIHDLRKRNIESWCNCGLADFSYHIFDDYKIVYRFDKCLVPEVLKEFNDPNIAYLASCYMGDHPEMNKDKVIHMRRTQTLQHSEFCDEFYWNNLVHPDAEQPSLEFVEKMGKDHKNTNQVIK